jgi:iron(III) transport system permease protein
MRDRPAWILFSIILVVLCALFAWPILSVVAGGFHEDGVFTLKYLLEVFRNPIYAEGLRNSLLLALGTTTLSMLVALPLAWLSHRFDFPGKSVFSALILGPMIL